MTEFIDWLLLGVQLQDAGTSTAANYHATCRAGSRAAFVAKLTIVVEEADEALSWLTRIQNAGLSKGQELDVLLQEANELVAVFTASLRTARSRTRDQRRGNR